MHQLDAIDRRLLRVLHESGRTSDVQLGDAINLSAPATARRRKMLEDQGTIAGYSANIDIAKLGYSVTVMVSVELISQAEESLTEFEAAVIRLPSITFCSFVSGDVDFIMILNVQSFADYDRVYRGELSTLPNVARIRSSFVLREVMRRNAPPIIFA